MTPEQREYAVARVMEVLALSGFPREATARQVVRIVLEELDAADD